MIAFDKSVDSIVVVGCGGVASWLLTPLVKLLLQTDRQPALVLYDGDTIELRNLDRQWFNESHIGMNKAKAMSSQLSSDYPMLVCESYYSDGEVLPVEGPALFIGCADNHAARRAILSAVDRGEGYAVIGGNEYTEAEAYYYEPGMKDTPTDPRRYIPAILTDTSGDPTRPAGCTGPAQEAAPQLVLANFSAANHIMWLAYHHFVERPALGKEYLKECMPVRTWNFGAKFLTHRHKDMVPPTETKEGQTA
jgi:molybdopterin/thiamine biosynthesis adenylyltransferase